MRSALTRAFRVLADCLGSSTSTRRGAAAATKAVPPSARNSCANRFDANLSGYSFCEPLEDRTLMSTYYVSPSGSDSNSGTSVSAPWKSTGKVSGTHLNPGDHVLFQGGQTFYGSLTLYNDGGSSSNPIVIGSYGSGQATINSGKATGAWSLNTTGITFDNLNFVGSPGNILSQDGIRLENDTGNTVRSGFTVEDCNISGYAEAGIVFGSDSSSEGLNDVTITNNNVYNNEENGIESYSVTTESNTNVYIAYNSVHNNYGDGKSLVTGNGITLQGLNGATVQYNAAYDNGLTGGSGNVGIWCYLSNDVLFQFNQSYGNVTRTGTDGDGFDFDNDTSNSIMQYNFSANNDGSGFMFSQWASDNRFTGNIIRYNISQNNGRRNNYSGIDVWGQVKNCQIYNNTVYITPGVSGSSQALRISNITLSSSIKPSNLTIVGNIFQTTGGTTLVYGYAPAIDGASGIDFAGNVYYSSGSSFHISWAGGSYSSLSAWEGGTKQETLSGSAVGLSANPMLKSPGSASPLATGSNLSAITAYQILSGSPLLSSKFSETAAKALGTTGATADFEGDAIPAVIIAGVDQKSTTGSTGSAPPTGSTSNSSFGTTTTVTDTALTGLDIGSPAHAGASSQSGNSASVTGGGSDIWSTADSFRYDYTTLSGNGQIIAEVTSQGESSTQAKAGVMIRNGTTSNAAEVSMLIQPDKTADFQARATAGAATTSKQVDSTSDEWVKLVRSGNTFSGYISTNGITWVLVETTTVSMNTVIDIGLAVTAHNNSTTSKATFSNIAIS
jgi:hypothetical protein